MANTDTRGFVKRAMAVFLGLLMVSAAVLAQVNPPADPGFANAPSPQSGAASRPAKLPEGVRARLQKEIESKGLVTIVVGLYSQREPDAALQLKPRKLPRKWLRRQEAVARLQKEFLSRLGSVINSDVTTLRKLQHAPVIAVEADERLLDALLEDPDVDYIRQAFLVRPTLNVSVPLIGADAPELHGTGQAVAVLDSGVDPTHGFLAGAILADAEGCFSSSVDGTTSFCPNGQDVQTGPGAGVNCPITVFGCEHGTHVAGIVAGAGAAFDGVAEASSIIPVQVFTRSDSFFICGFLLPCAIAWDFDVTAGLEHVLNLVNAGSLPEGLAAVNMSLGAGMYPTASGCDDVSPATTSVIDSLRTAGVATVVAAGNDGATTGMKWPACISGVVSVGASDDFDNVADFSNRSSWTTFLAPGVQINSSVPGDGNFIPFDGTSMAAPHVAGAIAAIRADAITKGFVPNVDNVVAALANSGVPVDDVLLPVTSDFTFPRIQVDAAAELFQPGDPPPVNLVIDDDDTLAGVPQSGVFEVFADTQAYRGQSLEGVDAGVDTYRFTPALPVPGLYRVYAWWPAATDNTTRALFTVAHDEGTTSVELDQTSGGGGWNELGTFSLGNTGPVYVEVAEADPAEPFVVADAVRFELLPRVQVRTKDLPIGFLLTRYAGTLEAAYGLEPYRWSLVSGEGALPAGLTLDPATGEISGTPTAEGASSFTVRVEDALGDTATRVLSITIDPPPAGTGTLRVSADNGEDVYFNGVFLGSSSNWRQGSEYSLFFREGSNVLAVKASDAGEVGALIAELELPTGLAVSDSSWKVQTVNEPGWAGVGFDDSGWVAATSYGQYGVDPWGVEVSGIPAGSPAQWIWSADANGDDEVFLRFNVNVARSPLAVQTTSLPAGEVNQPYDASLTATGGTGSYTWSIVSGGALPEGLTLDAVTGEISGTPTGSGTGNFTVQVEDGLGDTATQALSITVDLARATLRVSADNGDEVYFNGVLLGSSSSWEQGSEYSLVLRAGLNVVAVKGIDAGGVGALIAELELRTGLVVSDSSWKVRTVNEPGWAGVGFDDSGWAAATGYGQYGIDPWGTRVSGIPAGSPAQWIWSADSGGDDVVYFRYTVAVGSVALAVQTMNLPAGEVNQPYDASLTAIGGTGAYTWGLVSPGTLPAGLTLDGATGEISGTPTAEGTSNFTVRVQDGAGDTATQALSITIDPPPAGTGTLRISADNGEDVYFNGVFLGSSNNWREGGEYPLVLREGLNVVAVKGIDAGGVGALIAELELPSGLAVSDSSWKVRTANEPGWTGVGFDDSGWAAATSYGRYGIGPWGTRVSGIPAGSPAEWIWSADPNGDDEVFLRFNVNIARTPLAMQTTSLPAGEVDQPYDASMTAIGGTGAYSWSLVSPGTLPAGLALDAVTGEISGTPTAEGTSDFTVQVQDGAGDTATQALSITIDPPSAGIGTLRISADNGDEAYFNGVFLGSSSNWEQGAEYPLVLREGLNVVAVKGIDAGGVGALIAELELPSGLAVSDSSWKVRTVNEPGWAGVGFDDSGWAAATGHGHYGISPWGTRVSGIPAGSPAEWIWSADSNGDDVVYFRYAFAVGPVALAVQTTSLPAGELDQAYDASLSAIGGTGAYSWSLVSGEGVLPAGLTLDPATGEISGTPTTEGTSDFTVRVRDVAGDTATQALSITVDTAPPVQATLRISADNGEDVYFNGTFLGSSGNWKQGSEYTFVLREGLNVVAVKGIDGGAGVGALIAELDLPTGMVVTDSSWKVRTVEEAGWESPGFDDSGWVGASSYGYYGVGPWGSRVSVIPAGSPAEWIWSADNDGDDVVYFRLSFSVD